MNYYNNNTLLYLDDQFLPAGQAPANLYAQTLHYGYGAFEGIRAYKTESGTQLFKAKAHYERLEKSAELLHIPFRWNTAELIEKTYTLLEKNKFSEAYIRPLVFCDPNMSLTAAEPAAVHLMICAWEWPAYLGEKTLKLGISSFCRPHPRSTHMAAKACGHYVNSILATTDAKKKGYDEALLLDHEGFLAEGPGANLFFGKGKTVYTPAEGFILEGITRDTVMTICKELGLNLIVSRLMPAQLMQADYAFYCGTAAEVVGIESVDRHAFSKSWSESWGKKIQLAYKEKVIQSDTLKLQQHENGTQSL
jgi:branched-chain amino acid aminotransferase